MDSEKPFNILFLCTGNSARSILAEYILRRIGRGRFQTFSAGAKPKGIVNPLALRVLKEMYHIDASDARSKSWEEFTELKVHFDFVITVCDSAKETCPVFPGQPITAHWSSPDPDKFEGDEAARFDFFVQVAIQIQRRLELLCCLSFDKLNSLRIQELTREIGDKETIQEGKTV